MNSAQSRSTEPTLTDQDSQDSIFGKVKLAKENSDGKLSFLASIVAIFCASTVVIVLLVIFGIVVPIAPIVIGALYLDDCPFQKYIPIYLVVTGTISMLYCCYGHCCDRKAEEDGSIIDKVKVTVSRFCALCVIAWFIAGNVWVFTSYGDFSTDTASGNYCQPIAYYFAFWFIIVMYIFCGIFILLVCCCFCVSLCTCNEREDAQSNVHMWMITGVQCSV